MGWQEKASYLSGASFWHTKAGEVDGRRLPSLMLTDGPLGLRKQAGDVDHPGIGDSVPATCFPAECALACSFDPELLRQVGRAMASECRAQDVAVLLAPAINIKRSPLCGRNFEYMSEDPLLTGSLAAAEIAGIQSLGVGTSVKHLAANSQERARMVSDSLVDERALHEIYLRAFEICVRAAQPATLMAAYNRLNGTYCCENGELLTHILRELWGFRGLVMSDWGAVSDVAASVAAGLDLCMPGPRSDYVSALLAAVGEGALDSAAIDRSFARLEALVDRVEAAQEIPYEFDQAQNLALAQRAAEESAVLLDNDAVLPLAPHSSVAVIGAFAKHPRYQGAGSSRINPVALDNLWDALRGCPLELSYAEGYDVESGAASETQLGEAETSAQSADVAVVVAGLPECCESEGFDRTSMALPAGHVALIERVCRANPRTVVVLQCGAPVELPWLCDETCPKPAAVLTTYLGGCQSGAALARLLTGEVNPSGKLAETWPRRLADTALGERFPEPGPQIRYRESIYVGYRYFDAAGVEPAYPFGHGLSYTSFALSDMRLGLDHGRVWASCVVANTGELAGATVIQAYGRLPETPGAGCYRAPQALMGFAKVALEPGERRRVRLELDPAALAIWDARSERRVLPEGAYPIALGLSSRDHALVERAEFEAPTTLIEPLTEATLAVVAADALPEGPNPEPYAHPTPGCFAASSATASSDAEDEALADEAFAAIYGRSLPEVAPARPFTPDSPIGSLATSWVGRLVLKGVSSATRKVDVGEGTAAMMEASLMDMPLRSMAMGGVDPSVVGALVELLNGHPLRAFRSLRHASRPNPR